MHKAKFCIIKPVIAILTSKNVCIHLRYLIISKYSVLACRIFSILVTLVNAWFSDTHVKTIECALYTKSLNNVCYKLLQLNFSEI